MRPGNTVVVVIVVIVVLGIVCLALCGGLIYWGFSNATKTADPQIDAVFAAIEGDTMGQAYDTMTTSEFRAVTSRQQFQELGDTIATRLGKLQSKTLQSFNIQQHNSDSTIEVTYNAEFEKGPGTIMATLKDEAGQWKLLHFRVNSPEFDNAKQPPPAAEAPPEPTDEPATQPEE
ncbi:hypothetical protein NG895_04660 [Aeoliella sp. ICT_H6.2]|uniref:Uncharacterized protein n=1 Tax=Aeoliella straminimaris TaxID=2954799 RepID=A0A9X2F7N6_9BACT|nr:hypothetical protein [Aeoliella straminimaris]MCO6043188.1 hypothetical protein [Aeoliella straminimaris]